MKKSEHNEEAVSNFLGSMDMEMKKRDHILNAITDAISYGWSPETLDSICKGIEKAYSPNRRK